MIHLGLIGHPLGHSFSARYFGEKFRSEHIAGEYNLYPLEDIRLFPEFLCAHPCLNGLNVTIPHKESILPFLDRISEDATYIGAVNVISICRKSNGNFFLTGHNTDWIGFSESLRPLLRPETDRAVVLGSGGAGKAVTYAMRMMGLDVTSVSRSPSDGSIGYDCMDAEIIARSHLIVNATPLGMFPDVGHCPDIPYEAVTEKHLCYDLVYNPETTLFMHKCRERGATVKNGMEMLHRQADKAWEIWQKESR